MRNKRKFSLIALLMMFTMLGLISLSACAGKSKTKESSEANKTSIQAKSENESSTKNSTKSSTSSTSSASSAEKESSSQSQGQNQNATLSWNQLSVAQKNQLYAAWLQNSQGIYVVYTGYPVTYNGVQQNGTVFINQGNNGSHNSDGNNYAGVSIQEQINSALFVESAGTVTMMSPNGESSGGYSGNWRAMLWNVQESLSTQELINRYSAQMNQVGKQIKTTNAGSPA